MKRNEAQKHNEAPTLEDQSDRAILSHVAHKNTQLVKTRATEQIKSTNSNRTVAIEKLKSNHKTQK
jgi:hypothetical protein